VLSRLNGQVSERAGETDNRAAAPSTPLFIVRTAWGTPVVSTPPPPNTWLGRRASGREKRTTELRRLAQLAHARLASTTAEAGAPDATQAAGVKGSKGGPASGEKGSKGGPNAAGVGFEAKAPARKRKARKDIITLGD